MWVIFTLFAAFMQSWRNAFQSQLSAYVPTMGVTLARFIWASPLAGLYLLGLYQWQPAPIPVFSVPSLVYIMGAAVMQIVATALMVVLFKQKNYAIGVGLAKSEAVIAAILGVLFFNTALSLVGWGGVVMGAVAVFLLSGVGQWRQFSWSTICCGLGSGGAFALTSLWVREASIGLQLPFLHSAAWVLLLVIGLQTLLLLGYLALTNRPTIKALLTYSRLTVLISVSSFLGSIGWFSAMSLEAVPYVKTLGQIEVLFTLMISALWFKDKLKVVDVTGLALIVVAAVMVMWA